jgi:hypothetical protein
MAVMTTEEFIEKANLSKHQVRTWLESGLLEAKTVNGPDGPSQEFDAGQLTRARLLKALYAKGVSFARLSGADLAFDEAGYVVFDGNRLRSCRDAAAAINVVCHAKRWCSAVDLRSIRG